MCPANDRLIRSGWVGTGGGGQGGTLPFPSKGFQVISDVVKCRLTSSFHLIGPIKPIKHLIFVAKVGLFPAEAATVMSPVTRLSDVAPRCVTFMLFFYLHGSSKSLPETPGQKPSLAPLCLVGFVDSIQQPRSALTALHITEGRLARCLRATLAAGADL